MKLESNINAIIEEIAAQEAPGMQLEKLGEGELTDINEKTKRVKMTQRNYISQNFTLKKLSEIFQTLKAQG